MSSDRGIIQEPMASPRTELDVLRRLHELNMFMGSTTDLKQLLDRLLTDVIELLRADFGNIQLYDSKSKILKIVSNRGFKRPFLDHFAEVKAEEPSACGTALRNGERSVIEDVESDPDYAPNLAVAREAGYRAVQSTPMFGPLGELIGMISTHYRKPRGFTDMELWLTDLYARQAGFAIGAKRAWQKAQEEERRQRNLLAELQHRVRNTLAVIRSIVRRTALTSGTVEEFERHLDGRLGSFARTQGYVTRDPTGGIDLELILRDELLAHAAHNGNGVRLKGPEVRLNAKQAETIGLAIHELVSNAIKHGALASDGNRIDVNWSLKGKVDQRKLHFSWRERLAGQAVKAPSRAGFGTELLERVLSYELDAEPSLRFASDGLDYQLVVPLPPPGYNPLT